tara:strand:+ start:1937 stop:2203 length:267 start_codon:yes stop_codon:yes gene_type:complete
MGKSSRDRDIVDFAAVQQPDGSYFDRSGTISWYNEVGQLHKVDGPAIIYPDGCGVDWCLNDKHYLFNEWLIKLNKTDEEKMMLKLQYD